MKKSVINTFSGGMVKDLDKSIVPKNSYLHAENIRISSTNGNTAGAIVNVKGNTKLFDIESGTIIGHCLVRDDLIYFVKVSSSDNRIYKAVLDDNYNVISNTQIWPTAGVTKSLNFNATSGLDYKFTAVGRYESDSIKKVYFADSNNIVRFFNYSQPGFSELDPEYFEFTRKAVLMAPSYNGSVSGNMKSGKVQYLYKLYSTNGSETMFSHTSPLYHITDSSDGGSDLKYVGSVVDTVTSKGFIVHIKRVADFSKFDFIELVAVHYNTLHGVPEIRIVAREKLSNIESDLKIVDTGDTLGSYTEDELSIMSTGLFKASTLEINNDRLFAGNTVENYFETNWDARAYRFSSVDGKAYLYHDSTHRIALSLSGSSRVTQFQKYQGGAWVFDENHIWLNDPILNGLSNKYNISSSTWRVPEQHNAINHFNNISNINEPTAISGFSGIQWGLYQRQASTTAIGGEGNNISYTITAVVNTTDETKEYMSDVFQSKIQTTSTANHSQASPVVSTKLSFQGDEVYRLYIVLEDEYGRESFAKWVGDIRMPNFKNHATSGKMFDGDFFSASLVINFTVKSLPSSVKSYKFTYVKREKKDRNVLAQGLITRCVNITGRTFWESAPFFMGRCYVTSAGVISKYPGASFSDESFVGQTLFSFISPEISYGNDISYMSGDSINILAPIYMGAVNIKDKLKPTTVGQNSFLNRIDIYKTADYGTKVGLPLNNVGIAAAEIVDAEESARVVVYGLTFVNQVSISNDDIHRGCGCKKLVLRTNAALGLPSSTVDCSLFLVNYMRNVFASQYGGHTYSARQLCKSVSCSERFGVSTVGTAVTAYGDTFIGWFDTPWVYTSLNRTAHDTFFNAVYFQCESSINLRLGHGKLPHAILYDSNLPYMRHTAGRWFNRISGSDGNDPNAYYNQEYDLFAYNSVYSKTGGIKEYSPKPVDWKNTTITDFRIKYSDVKINGEYIDSFTKFRINNYRDVDSQYGEINNIVAFRNNLYFYQDTAFGLLSVNTRSLITSSDGLPLSLGTGGVLDRYDYISTTIGNSKHFDIIKSIKGLYWYDVKNKDFFRYSEGLLSLGKSKNIQSYINTGEYYRYMIGAYDSDNNEIIITLKYAVPKTVIAATDLGQGGINVRVSLEGLIDGLGGYINNIPSTYVSSTTQSILFNYRNSSVLPQTGDIVYIYQDGLYKTLAFSELYDSFMGIYTFNPSRYIQIPSNFITSNSNLSLYVHNSGDYGRFYGTLNDSILTLIINDEYQSTKIFDNIEFETSVYNYNNVDMFADTWTEVRFYNDYQNTDYNSIIDTGDNNITRRDRSWTMEIPRNRVYRLTANNPDIFNVNNLDLRGFGDRLRDKHLVIDFKYNNIGNHRLTMPYIITTYRYSIR